MEVQSLTHWTAKKSPFSSVLKEVPIAPIILGHDALFSTHVASTFHYEINLSTSFVERKVQTVIQRAWLANSGSFSHGMFTATLEKLFFSFLVYIPLALLAVVSLSC